MALLSRRFAPLGLLLLGPVVVNIVFYDIDLVRKFNPVGTGVAVAFSFPLLVYRKSFGGVFAVPRRSFAGRRDDVGRKKSFLFLLPLQTGWRNLLRIY